MRSAAAVAVGGVLYALALPPAELSAWGWIALVPLIVAASGGSVRSALYLGALGGYVTGWCVQWWFAETVRHYFALSVPVGVLATVFSVLAVWALPFALFGAAVALLHRRVSRVCRPPLIAAAWVATELVRTRLTGQPWGLLGYSQHTNLPVIQIAAWTGVYGVSFLLALTSAALADALQALRCAGRRALWQAALWLAVPFVAFAVGTLALEAAAPGGATHEIVIVQANVSPARHWTRAYSERQLRIYLDLTRQALKTSRPQLIVWPENAVTGYPERNPLVAARLATLVRQTGADLLFGAPRVAGGHVYNSARLLRSGARDVRYYDKHVLVPFAESSVLAPRLVDDAGDPESFSPGTGSGMLKAFVPVGVSICHEILHSDVIARSVRDGATVLVNIANDGLVDRGFGVASAQHAAMAVLRAVETRRFLVRAATTGPSIVVGPTGRVMARIAEGTSGSVVARVEERRQLTPYVLVGDVFAAGCLLVVAAALVPFPLRRRSSIPALASVSS